MAGDTWYHSNKTQPSREQPWYHILVHDSGGISTYVAQSNLKEDTSGQPVSTTRINATLAISGMVATQLKASGGASGGGGI